MSVSTPPRKTLRLPERHTLMALTLALILIPLLPEIPMLVTLDLPPITRGLVYTTFLAFVLSLFAIRSSYRTRDAIALIALIAPTITFPLVLTGIFYLGPDILLTKIVAYLYLNYLNSGGEFADFIGYGLALVYLITSLLVLQSIRFLHQVTEKEHLEKILLTTLWIVFAFLILLLLISILIIPVSTESLEIFLTIAFPTLIIALSISLLYFLAINIARFSLPLLLIYGGISIIYSLYIRDNAFYALRFLLIAGAMGLFLYILYRAIQDNRPVMQALIAQGNQHLFAKALVLWSPFSLFVIAGLFLSKLLFDTGAWLQQGLSENGAPGAVSSTFGTLLETLSILSLLALLILIVKSLVYVFARISVSLRNELPATLAGPEHAGAEPPEPAGQGCLTQDQEYFIYPETGGRFYVARSFAPSGCPPKLAVPQWHSSLIRRILNKAYLMNEIDTAALSGPAHLTATGSAHFIEWTLQEGEELVFSYKDFVGMSESVRLFTFPSLRITSMIFGEIFHACARGPGKVVLISAGKARCYPDGRDSLSAPRSRLLAFRRTAAFDVIAEQSKADIFFSGIHLRCASADPIVIDADERKAPEGGLGHFATKFLLPV